MSAWLVALLLAVSQGHVWGWGSPITVGLFAIAAVVLPIWVWAEARSDSPLIDMKMMRIPTVWTVNLVSLLFGMGMYSMFAFLPQFLQTSDEVTGYGFSASVTQSGLMLLPQTVATFVAGLASGRLAARYGSKAMLVAGATLTSLGTLGIVVAHDYVWQLLVESTVLGLAFGLAFAAMSNLIVDAVPQTQTGVASGMNANIRTIGGSIGSALMASVVTAHMGPGGLPREAGYVNGFLLLTGALVLAALAAILIPAVRRDPATREEPDVPLRHPEAALVAGGTLVGDDPE
jgi:MFS family permease